MHRVRDTDRFVYQLNRPPIGAVVTEEDLAADGDSFVAFAAAFGIKPRSPAPEQPDDVPSSASV